MNLIEFLNNHYNNEAYIQATNILQFAFDCGFMYKYTTLEPDRIIVSDETNIMYDRLQYDPSKIINLVLRTSPEQSNQILRLVIKNGKVTMYNKLHENPIEGFDGIEFNEAMNVFNETYKKGTNYISISNSTFSFF